MDIYNKINQHLMLNNDDVKNIVNERIRELGLSNKQNHVYFRYEKDLYMEYYLNETISISNNYKFLTLRPILNDKLVKIVKKTDENSSFLNDVYNLELLYTLYHEVRHFEQWKNIIKGLDDYNILINNSLKYMNLNYTFYEQNHSKFLSEFDADLSAMMKIFEYIEDKIINVSEDAIYFHNSWIAYSILRSRGYKLKNFELKHNSIFKSPLHFLYLYTKHLYNRKEIDKKELNNVNCSIFRIRKNNKTEYDRIISGDNLNDGTINELFLIRAGKIKTKNIFKYFEEKEIDKNNSEKIKKLLLK